MKLNKKSNLVKWKIQNFEVKFLKEGLADELVFERVVKQMIQVTDWRVKSDWREGSWLVFLLKRRTFLSMI